MCFLLSAMTRDLSRLAVDHGDVGDFSSICVHFFSKPFTLPQAIVRGSSK
jgi:hypothetical protein